MNPTDRRSLPAYAADAIEIPFVIGGMDERLTRDTQWAEHSHPTHELLWNEYGASRVTVGTRTWTITPTLGLWVPAGVLHSGFAPGGTWYRTSMFGVRSVPSISDEPVTVEVTPLLTLLLLRLAEDALNASSRALTESMVLDVLEPSPHELLVHVPRSPLLRPIVESVLENPGDPRTLTDWATALRVSARTITRAFRSESGLGFTRWVATVRAQRAVTMLSLGEEIENVAGAVGYRSVSAFGAAFRRTTGVTPGTFRGESTSAPRSVRDARSTVTMA